MRNSILTLIACMVGGLLPRVSSAQAPDVPQADPEAGDTSQWQGGAEEIPPVESGGGGGDESSPPSWMGGDSERPPGLGPSSSSGSGSSLAEEPEVGETDHSLFVGKWGFGLLGVTTVPVGIDPAVVADAAAVGAGTVKLERFSTPTLGVRYWLKRSLGVELGFGVSWTKRTLDVDHYTDTLDQGGDVLGGYAFAVHAGLPIILKEARHYNFLVLPEVDAGFGTATVYGAAVSQDQYLSGTLVRAGVRAGAEIHFGFIDVPQFALQATLGAAVRYWSGSDENQLTSDNRSAFTTGTTLDAETTLGDSAVDVFAANVAAIYYVR